jgi:hypothetical protein
MRVTCVLHGRRREDKLIGDLGVRETPRHELEDLKLARCEFLDRRRDRRVLLGLDHLLDQPGVHRWRKQRLAAATVLIPSISCSGATSLSRNPLAPACSAPYTYSSRSKVVRITDSGRSGRGELPRSLDPVGTRHPDVHQHHLRLGATHRLDRFASAACFGHDVDIVRRVDDHPQPGPDERLVIGNRDRDAHRSLTASGSSACIAKVFALGAPREACRDKGRLDRKSPAARPAPALCRLR